MCVTVYKFFFILVDYSVYPQIFTPSHTICICRLLLVIMIGFLARDRYMGGSLVKSSSTPQYTKPLVKVIVRNILSNMVTAFFSNDESDSHHNIDGKTPRKYLLHNMLVQEDISKQNPAKRNHPHDSQSFLYAQHN